MTGPLVLAEDLMRIDIGFLRLVTGGWLLVTGLWQLATGSLLLVGTVADPTQR